MAIRIRKVEGVTVALCAAETDALPDDMYLDDNIHYALAAKFCHDYQGKVIDWRYPIEWAAMETQKLRDAEEEITKWAVENNNYTSEENDDITEDLDTCEQCGENSWDGYICHSCGLKEI